LILKSTLEKLKFIPVRFVQETMTFEKFPSLQNYNSDMKFEENNDSDFCAREKVDGSNVQFLFQRDKTVLMGKRNECSKDKPWMESENATLFNKVFEKTVEEYAEDFKLIQEDVNADGLSRRVFGEFYGPSVNKRIDYGSDHRICAFVMYINGEIMSQHALTIYFKKFKKLKLAPLIKVGKLMEMISIPLTTVHKQYETFAKDDVEGIVVYLWHDKASARWNTMFKIKSDAFKDIEKVSKQHQQNSLAKNLNVTYNGYFTSNRIIDAMSKIGTDQSFINDIKAEIIRDVNQDFDENEMKNLAKLNRQQVNQAKKLRIDIVSEIKKLTVCADNK
jgi:hypothetical protein